MTTTHPCLLGQRTSVPQPHLLFTPKNSLTPDLSTNHKPSNLRVSIGFAKSLASPFISSTWNPKKQSRSYLLNCAAVDKADTSSSEDKWDWERWNRHFSEIDQVESVVSLLKAQLQDAVEKEDFEEAAKLKKAIGEATANDAVAEIMCQLQTAIRDERYHDASRLCNETGCGLVGWWVAKSQYTKEPYGRIVHITPGVGRFIGMGYSPRQLVAKAAGTPLFEIFVVKDTDGGYVMQVVLQYVKHNPFTSENSYLRAEQSSKASVDDSSILDVRGSEVKVDKKSDKLLNAEETTEEGIKNVIKFIKDKIPGLKLKVNDVIRIPEEETVGSDDDSEELVGEGIEETSSAEEEEEEGEDDGKHLNTKLVIGGVLHNIQDSSIKDEIVRISGDIMDTERDSFILYNSVLSDIDKLLAEQQVTAPSAQVFPDVMPPDVFKAFWDSKKASLKVSTNTHAMFKLARERYQEENHLSEYTAFNRIKTPENNLDPFVGLYVGAFGPCDTEVVQLKRKYGRWDDAEGGNSSDMEFFEYVEAVKLTGDPNVPAGQVTFRARIENAKQSHGIFPEDLGVLAGYSGQGRIADAGFKNPKWVNGVLLKLNGKGVGPYLKGGDLGFVYIVPGEQKSFLVIFTRLKLPQ